MKLTKRETDIMEILWKAEKPLMVSEVVQRDEGGTIYSVQRVMQNLLKKGMVEIDGYGYNKKSMGRKFKATENYEVTSTVKDLFEKLLKNEITASHLVASLIPQNNNANALKEIEKLEMLIEERKKQIQESNDI